jgi:hypothetical protein
MALHHIDGLHSPTIGLSVAHNSDPDCDDRIYVYGLQYSRLLASSRSTLPNPRTKLSQRAWSSRSSVMAAQGSRDTRCAPASSMDGRHADGTPNWTRASSVVQQVAWACNVLLLPCSLGVDPHLSPTTVRCIVSYDSTHGAPFQSTDGNGATRDSTIPTVALQSTVPCYYGAPLLKSSGHIGVSCTHIRLCFC